jgi:cysteinyl-tRNA synthetase
MHNGFVEIDSQKMSKSLGNFFTVRDLLTRFDGEGIRFFLLGTQYRNPISFSDPLLEEAERRLGSLYETLAKADRLGDAAQAAPGPAEWVERARAALDDDFNTAAALGIIAEAFTAANALADHQGKKSPPDRAELFRFARDARLLGSTLGILQRPPAEALLSLRAKAVARRGIDPALVEAKIAERDQARKAKDFARSDAIREELSAMGVALMDGPQGTTWKVE